MQSFKHFWGSYPVLSNWIVLAVGMVIFLYFSARHVGFLPAQWAALIERQWCLPGCVRG